MFGHVKDKIDDWKDRLAYVGRRDPVFDADDNITDDDDSVDDPKKSQPSKDPNIGVDPIIKVVYEGKKSSKFALRPWV